MSFVWRSGGYLTGWLWFGVLMAVIYVGTLGALRALPLLARIVGVVWPVIRVVLAVAVGLAVWLGSAQLLRLIVG